MYSPVSPGIDFDFTVLEECRGTTFIALQDAQKKKRIFENVAIGIDLQNYMIYFHNFLCGRTKTGGPALIWGTVASSYFC
jgi:hypothetical protein